MPKGVPDDVGFRPISDFLMGSQQTCQQRSPAAGGTQDKKGIV
jgi:hypothetical protein